MKLRMTDKQVRVRLSDEEVIALSKGKSAFLSTHFGGLSMTFNCEITSDDMIEETTIQFTEGTLSIGIPKAMISDWANSDQEGIYAQINNEINETLEVAIEKDYPCKH